MNSNPKVDREIRVAYPAGCLQCGYGLNNPFTIQIVSIDSLEGGWMVRGKGKNTTKLSCPACGQLYEAVAHSIPLQCSQIPCPICGKYQDFNFKIRSIKTGEDSFEFEAEMECAKCKKKKTFKKTLKKIFNVINLEISSNGITVKSK